MISISPEWFTLISAELLFLIVRSNDLQVLFKRESQRTYSEQHRVQRGLYRSIILEMILFVPASAGLVLMMSPLLLPDKDAAPGLTASYAILGIASYGFPFATIRAVVTRIALSTLREFAQLQPEETKQRAETNPPKSD